MKVYPTLQPSPLPPRAVPSAVRNWQVGQLVQATAATDSQRGQALLQIGNTTVRAQVPFEVRAGQSLALEVVEKGPVPLLRPAPQQTATTEQFRAAVRAALPRQAPLPPLLANLGALAMDKPGIPTPDSVRQAARELFRRLPERREVSTVQGLRRAVGNSGVQLEAKLAAEARGQAPADTKGDVKAGLLRLRQSLEAALARAPAKAARPAGRGTPIQPPAPVSGRPLPPASLSARPPAAAPPGPRGTALLPPLGQIQPRAQPQATPSLLRGVDMGAVLRGLLGEVEGALARTQVQQLAPQQPDGDSRLVWLLEMPVRREQGTDLFHLRVQRDCEGKHGQEGEPEQWTVVLAFDLPGLGPVHAQITVRDKQVATRFRTAHATTAELFRRHLDELSERLDKAGLQTTKLSCHTGLPPEPEPSPPTDTQDHLLSEQA